MKQNILVAIMSLLFTSSAVAYNCPIGVDDNTILEGLEIVSTEINSYNHSEKAMKKSYRKLCRIEKILKRQRGRNCRAVPAEITDADLLSFIDNIAQEIEDNDHRRRKMFFTSIKLNRLNRLLVKRRTSPQVDELAVLELSDSDPFDFGVSPLNTPAVKLFNITNSGTADATTVAGAVAAPFAFVGGSYPGTGGTCGATIAIGQTCSIAVEFVPQAIGAATSDLEISYFNNVENELITKELQGTGL